jgi:cell division protein FtsA
MHAERDLGVALLDIGGGTSDLAIFRGGDICYSAVIPVGGNYVSRDISAGLRTTQEEAERVKLAHGLAQVRSAPEDAVFSFTHLGGSEPTEAPLSLLAEIIEPRVTELFMLVKQEINRSNYGSHLPGGMVISGGGAMLTGLVGLAGEITDMPVRIGFPSGVGGLSESVSAPSFATAVGLVQWGGRAHAGLLTRREQSGGLISAISAWMRRVFRDVLGQ